MSPSKKKKSRKWIWIAVLVLLAAGGFWFVSAGRQASDALFETETAALRDLVTYYSFSGNLTPASDEVQTAKDSGKVREVYVSEGDVIQEGDALLRCTDGSRIYAAHSGTIETLYTDADDSLQPGSQLARIVDYDTLEVSINVDEYDIGAVSVGKEGDVYLNALNRTVPGVVSDVARSATMEGGVSYYQVTMQIDAGADVRSGMSVEVNILNQQQLQAVSVSLDALMYDEYNKPYVYQKNASGELIAVPVTTGVSDGRNIQIVYGLTAGDEVYYQSSNLMRFFQMQREMMGGR